MQSQEALGLGKVGMASLDPKIGEALKEKGTFLEESRSDPSVLFCADEAENITVYVNGCFAVARFNLKLLQ